MKTIWERITLMSHCHPDDDYKVTPLRFVVGVSVAVGWVFGLSVIGWMAGF